MTQSPKALVQSGFASIPIASAHEGYEASATLKDGQWTICGWHIDCAGEPISASLACRALGNFLLAEADRLAVCPEEIEFINSRIDGVSPNNVCTVVSDWGVEGET